MRDREEAARARRDCHLGVEHGAAAGENSEYDPPADWQELTDEIIDLRDRLAIAEETVDYLEREVSAIREALNANLIEA